MPTSKAGAAALALLLLAGCGRAPEKDARTIACGPADGATDQRCGLEVVDRKGKLTLVLRQPEGGFRRLVWPKGGTLAASDGAEPLKATALPGGGVEAVIGGWRYRIERDGGGLP